MLRFSVILFFKFSTISFFAFSTENWTRPKIEVAYLMGLLERTLDSFTTQKYEGVKLIWSGRKKLLPTKVLKKLEYVINATKNNKDLVVNFNFNFYNYLFYIN